MSLPTIKRLESRPGPLAAHTSTVAALRKGIGGRRDRVYERESTRSAIVPNPTKLVAMSGRIPGPSQPGRKKRVGEMCLTSPKNQEVIKGQIFDCRIIQAGDPGRKGTSLSKGSPGVTGGSNGIQHFTP